jgi:hypothetical protein
MFRQYVNRLRSEHRVLFHQYEGIMKNLTEKTIINQIEWTNNESDMHISCTVKNGFFEYKTILVLPGTELNRVITKLQQQNDILDIQDCLEIEQWSEDEFRYVFNFKQFQDSEFIFQNQLSMDSFKQIRA